jgi:hypothetical protein
MKDQIGLLAGAIGRDHFPDGAPLSADDRLRAQMVYGDLAAIGMPRVNMLLTGMDSVVRNLLETILIDLQAPIASWHPGQLLVLPPVARNGTMILHDIDQMALEDQLRLLDWLDQAAGKVQIVSTASTNLMPLVRAGTFDDRLYYRLNTVLVDASW